MKRIISLLLALSMVMNIIPIGEIVAFADDSDAEVKKIIINKTYESIEDYGTFFITITGSNLDKAEIKIIESGGALKDPIKSPTSGKSIAQYSYPASNIGQRLFINGEEYSLGEEDIPRITGRGGATTPIVDSGKAVTLTGEKIENLKDEDKKVKGYFSQSSSKVNIKDDEVVVEGDDAKIVKNVGTVLGSHSLVFEKKTTENGVPLEIEHTYKSIITVRGDLTVTGEISIFPSQGPRESLVTITADKIESNVSVFLMKKGEEYKYTKENMAQNNSVSHVQENGKEKVKFEVPKGLKNGLHEIVLTNKVDPSKAIDEQISKYKKIGNATGVNFKTLDFNVVDGNSGVDLKKITPNFSSIKGIPAQIEGRNIIKISSNLYVGGKIVGNEENGIYEKKGIDIESNKKEMVVNFEGGKYNGKEVKNIKRTITVQIGTNADFTGYNIKGDVYDYLDIIVPENDDLDKPVKDVIVFITNEIEFKDETKATITEGDTIEKGFTYNPIDYQPKINTILPNSIPVDSHGKVTDNFVISITGESFLRYGYVENKNLKTKTPKISIDKQGTSLEWFDNDNIKIYDKSGKLLEDKEGEQFGNIIKINIKKGSQIPDTIINSTQKLKLQNPLAIESEGDMGSYAFGELKFVKVEVDETPVITDVSPSIITVDGGDNITIKGTNFDEKVKIILDGEEIKGFERNGVGTELKFKAPSKPEGIYQIIVQNPNGGATTFDKFEYVQTRTKPKLTSFTPKEGTQDTLVKIWGENFVSMDPLVKDISSAGMNRLVGTRVLLGGEDVSRYNKDASGRIILKEFKSSDKLVSNKDGNIEMMPYASDVVLVKENGGIPNDKYFKIYKSVKTGKIILTDGNENEDYELLVESGKIYAKHNNNKKEVDLSTEGIFKIKDGIEESGGVKNDLDLKIKTPYLIENTIIRYKNEDEEYIEDKLGAYVKDITDGKYLKIEDIDIEEKKDDLEKKQRIVGNNVKVLKNGELIFIVPKKMKEGYYDLTIVNPDTKSDSKRGKDGFYYFLQPQRPITITKIYPNKGSSEGDYYIDIEGTNFKDNGNGDKPRVIIGGVQIDPKDIEVSTNGKNLRVKVPKYPGDLNAETDTGRRTVPVVVVNPDGASASVEEGFTYIVPKSNPQITKLIPDKGSAAGGEIINIFGKDFRFYEPYVDLNGNNKWDDKGESDTDGDGLITDKDPAEPFDDLNEDETWTNLEDKSMGELTDKDKKILPTIYFGNNEADIVSFREGQIDVKVPAGKEGTVDVYLVNNDYGTSNKVKYKYESSKPKINSITPKVGKKQGKDKVEILGTEFHESIIKVIKDENSIETRNMPLIQFGNLNDKNITNKDIPISQQYSGQIIGGESTVKVGDLVVKYASKGNNTKLFFTLDRESKKELVYNTYDNATIYFPMQLLDNNLYEYVKVSLENIGGVDNAKRVRVDRGYSPESKLLNSAHITLQTPSYYTIGKVKVTIINPDGGTVQGDFEYKNPDSMPKITDIQKDSNSGTMESGNKVIYVNTKGGNLIDVIGEDFRKPVKISIGDIVINTNFDYDPKDKPVSEKVTFTMPKVDDKYAGDTLYPLILENEDGGVISSKESSPPIYIKFYKGESNPEITSISPMEGPSKGGTKVTIKGKDFRERMQNFTKPLRVYFDDGVNVEEIPKENIKIMDIETIEVIAPPNKTKLNQVEPIEATIRIENPDGSLANSREKFKYVGPSIENIIKSEGTAMGGETVFIEGELFKFDEPFNDKNKNGKWDLGETPTDLNENGKYDDLLSPIKTMDQLSQKDKKILPKIFFGDQQAEVLSFTEKTIEVKVPKGKDTVDVYLLNNNGERSNSIKYNYTGTKPIIESITPNQASKDGGAKVEILGSGFYEGELRVYKDNKLLLEKTSMMLVQFAEDTNSDGYKNISNKNINDTNNKNVGIFSNNKATVEVGNLKVEYDGVKQNNKHIKVSLKVGEDVYSGNFEYDDMEILLPLSLLKSDSGKEYEGCELVKISKGKLQGSNNIYRLVIERGYAEGAKLEKYQEDKQKIVIEKIPGYYDEKKIKVEVTNPDGESSNKEFEYKKPPTNPIITNIVDPLNGNVKKETLSIEGNEVINIIGNDFMTGAKVIFSPVIKKASENPNVSGEKIFIGGVEYILESGTPGTDIEFRDSKSIKVKTPSGKLDTGGVIVINPDNGATPIYNLKYDIPEISHPQEVRASLIQNQYIRINWREVIDEATEADGKKVQYEIYVIEDGKQEFIGSTTGTGFVYRDIKRNKTTDFKFLVRAVGKYGSSKPINESMSNVVTVKAGAGPIDKDGEPGEKTKVEKSGETANIIIGRDAFDGRNEFTIDLTRGELSGSKEVVIRIPSRVVANEKNKTINIIGRDYNLSFTPNVFESSKILANKENNNSGVSFKVLPVKENLELVNNAGNTVIATQYLLDGKVFVGASSDNIENLKTNMDLVLDYDSNMAISRRLQNISLVRYDGHNRNWENAYGNMGYGSINAKVNKLGTYTIIGSRR